MPREPPGCGTAEGHPAGQCEGRGSRGSASAPPTWLARRPGRYSNASVSNVNLLLTVWNNLKPAEDYFVFELYFFMASRSRGTHNKVIRLKRLCKQYRPAGIFFGTRRSPTPSRPGGAP